MSLVNTFFHNYVDLSEEKCIENTCNSDRGEATCNILIEVSLPITWTRITKMCLITDAFLTQNDLKQDVLSPLLFNFALK
jgi:hypothetical protein